MRSAKAKNNIAQNVFAEYQDRYDRGLPVKSPEVLLDQLTILQRGFIVEYLKDLNATQAILRAGYNTKFPNRIATQLLHNPRIKLCIALLTQQRANKSSVTKDYVLKKLMKIIESCEDGESPAEKQAALRGLELIARHLGMFVDKTEITGKDGAAIQYEKIEEDARDFTSAITSLAERAGTSGVPLRVVGGTES